MPSDDRERKFEDALASHLRAGSSAGASHSACSDAETLAAYHERSLAPEQMAALKTHVTGCERCRQILAHLGATDEIPVAAASRARQATAAAKSGVHVLPARRPAFWRWVAPAGALAAALLVWIAVRESNSVRVPAQGPRVNLEQAGTVKDLPLSSSLSTLTPPLDATPKKEAASSDAFEALNTAPQSKIAGAPKERLQSPLKEKHSSTLGKLSSAPDVRDNFSQLADNSLNRNVSPALEEGLKSRVDAARTEAEGKAANTKRDALFPGPPQPAPERSAIAGTAAAAPAPPSARAEVLSESAAVAGRVTQQQEMGGMSRFKRKAEMRLANSPGEVIISAPGGSVSWKVGQAGIIEFSSDAGKTWTLQPSDVITDLLAGSAPSEKICWIVGRSGAILRTTDGGAHWQKVRPPTQDDLRSVFAVDARQATVSPTNGAYQTTDGGATWKKLAPE